jgi:hypothetical protein
MQGLNPTTKRLEIATTPNQDPLLNLVPVIGVDIWEHAFYLQYLNVKPDVRLLFSAFCFASALLLSMFPFPPVWRVRMSAPYIRSVSTARICGSEPSGHHL